MDNFEKHIRENKQLFNEHKADKSKLWANIATELDKPTTKVIPFWKTKFVKVAAGVAIIIGLFSSIVIGFYNPNPISNNFSSQELVDIDMHYQAMVASQVKLVRNNTNLSESDKDEFLSFMDELDEEYNELIVDLSDNLDNELVLEAIISNYKKRIELIENLLNQINKSKNIATENDEYIL